MLKPKLLPQGSDAIPWAGDKNQLIKLNPAQHKIGKRYFRTDVSTIPLAPVYKGKPKDRWVPVKRTNPSGLRDGLKNQLKHEVESGPQ